ncbi:hypothetical protein SAMN05444008_101368 [Cnuella takakiae]|uniref:Uncharacterized protein n=1 Tax=Cnuella takakiae TaxID=1302690 RepID=A0A1M4TB41_9BACT|nr:hypothetical protein [Cnuella takakiae]OLY90701.1 hypothetical protein BUE76_01400 [Cnuella takakiae]SHE41554.1 hypothetical protein SAMN05444008_101368 [Cnuella takakiae]
MASAQPILFMELGFFDAFVQETKKPFLNVAQRANLSFLYELIFKRSSVYLDLDDQTICQVLHALHYGSDLPLGINQETALNIQVLSSNNKLKSCQNTIEIVKDPTQWSLLSGQVLPTYLLVDQNEREAIRVANQTGIITIPRSFKFNRSISSFAINTIECVNNEGALQSVNLGNLMGPLPAAHSIIIEDPYLHTEGEEFLTEFLVKLHKPDLRKIPLHILVMVQDQEAFELKKGAKANREVINRYHLNFSRLCHVAKLVYKKSNGVIHVEIVANAVQKMHDRNILSNAYWISCGHSFKGKYDTNTEWTIRPIGLYFSQFTKRLEFIRKALAINMYHSLNYLLN